MKPAHNVILSVVLLLLLVLLALVACRPATNEPTVVTEVVEVAGVELVITRVIEETPTPTPASAPAEPIEEPVVLDLAYQGELPNLDPQQTLNAAGEDLVENLFVGLTSFNAITETVEPELAEAWQVSPDGLTWTFDLRDDVYWLRPTDAPADPDEPWEPEVVRRVTSDDVIFAVERVCSRGTTLADAFILFLIQGCEALYAAEEVTQALVDDLGARVLDENTVQFSLTEPASYFLTITTLPMLRPVPRELVDEFGDEWQDIVGEFAGGWQTPENILTSGPFLPSATEFGKENLRLHSNPLWQMPQTGNVDQVNIVFMNDSMAMYEAWRRTQLDVSVLPPEVREEFLSQTPAKAQLVADPVVFYVGFNLESAVFREPQIRRAFSASIDREQLVEEMFEGRGLPMRHFTPPGIFGAPPVDMVGIGYSPDQARQEMVGSSLRNCKLIPQVTFLVSTADLSLLQAELVRSMWIQELECNEAQIEIEQVEFGELLARTRGDAMERPDMWELAWPPHYPDAHNVLYDLLHCTDGENRQKRVCDEADRLLREASVTPNLEQRRELYRRIENLWFGEGGSQPLIPLYVRGDYLVLQSWLEFTPASFGGVQYDTVVIDAELKRLERSRSEDG